MCSFFGASVEGERMNFVITHQGLQDCSEAVYTAFVTTDHRTPTPRAHLFVIVVVIPVYWRRRITQIMRKRRSVQNSILSIAGTSRACWLNISQKEEHEIFHTRDGTQTLQDGVPLVQKLSCSSLCKNDVENIGALQPFFLQLLLSKISALFNVFLQLLSSNVKFASNDSTWWHYCKDIWHHSKKKKLRGHSKLDVTLSETSLLRDEVGPTPLATLKRKTHDSTSTWNVLSCQVTSPYNSLLRATAT